MKEVWRDIKGYKGIYQVSNLGRVKSISRYRKGKSNSLVYLPEKILNPKKGKNGYLNVGLSKNGIPKTYYVHRLVYETFRGKIPFWMQVNHINEDKTDNRLENLNVLTPKANLNWGTAQKRRSEKESKVVYQYDLDGNFIKMWSSTHKPEIELGYSNGSIAACCIGYRNQKTAYGFIWRYEQL